MKILEVIKLKKTFKTDFYKKANVVLKDVSFSVDAGQFVGFIGPNGAGKTTTIKCILQLIFPNSGEIHFFGEKQKLEHRKKIGFLPERPFFQEFLTGLEFLKLHWDLTFDSNQGFNARAEKVLEQVKLSHAKDKKLKEYSKGMLQRIGIAQALLTEPQFLVLDEPMSGLDPDGRILIKQILRDLKENKMTVLMSSHLLEDLDELCDQLIVIHVGKIEYTGSLPAFKKDFKNLEEAYRQFKIDLRVDATDGLNA